MLALFCACTHMSAHDNFYYYKGSQITINVDNSKVAVIARNMEDTSVAQAEGWVLEQNIGDSSYTVSVYSVPASTIPESCTNDVVPCYKTADGTEIVPNGYINVKLKNASDYSLLESTAIQN